MERLLLSQRVAQAAKVALAEGTQTGESPRQGTTPGTGEIMEKTAPTPANAVRANVIRANRGPGPRKKATRALSRFIAERAQVRRTVVASSAPASATATAPATAKAWKTKITSLKLPRRPPRKGASQKTGTRKKEVPCRAPKQPRHVSSGTTGPGRPAAKGATLHLAWIVRKRICHLQGT